MHEARELLYRYTVRKGTRGADVQRTWMTARANLGDWACLIRASEECESNVLRHCEGEECDVGVGRNGW